jgi:hypothetical protein
LPASTTLEKRGRPDKRWTNGTGTKASNPPRMIKVDWRLGPAFHTARRVAAGTPAGGRRRPTPHQKRGHFRSYWTGQGRTTQVLRFIKSFWVNLDLVRPSERRHRARGHRRRNPTGHIARAPEPLPRPANQGFPQGTSTTRGHTPPQPPREACQVGPHQFAGIIIRCDHRKKERTLTFMVTRDIFQDLASLAHPIPERIEIDPTFDEDHHKIARRNTADAQHIYAKNLREAWEITEQDPFLAELAYARQVMLAAEKRLRLLIAYGREFVSPRPYRLEDLAHAAGMSISGVRTAYDDDEIDTVAGLTGAKPRRSTTAANDQ